MTRPNHFIGYSLKYFSVISWVLLLSLYTAQTSWSIEAPDLHGRVNDNAGMLSPATVQQLEFLLTSFEEKESTQIALLTINSLQGENLEAFSLKVVEKWQLGRADLDNGALLLIAKNDRKIRIEVGYGLEGGLTDLTAGRIIRNDITPQFKNGNFDQGVIDGITAMIAAVEGEYTGEPLVKKQGKQEEMTGYIIFVFFLLFNLGRIFGRNKLLGAAVGAVVLPFVTSFFMSFSWPLFLALIPACFIVGYLSSMFLGRSRSRSSRRVRRSRNRNSNTFPGGFGGGSFGGGGGFSGGGGGFGGGGSSGGW